MYNNTWNHLIVGQKWAQVRLKTLSTTHIYLIYMYQEGLALNNLEWLIYHKTKPN